MKDFQEKANTSYSDEANSHSAELGKLDDIQLVKTVTQIVKVGVYRSFPLTEELYCNEQFLKDFNIKATHPHEIYLEFLQNLHPEDQESFYQYIKKLRKQKTLNFYPGEEIQNILLRVYTDNDKYKYVHIFTNVEEWNPAEKKICFTGISKSSSLPATQEVNVEHLSIRGDEQTLFYQSITTQKNIQRELNYNQALLNLALDYANINVFLYHFASGKHAEGEILLYGQDPLHPLQLTSVPWNNYLQLLHPDDVALQKKIYKQLLNKEIKEFKIELRIRLRKEMRWIEVNGHVHETDNKGNPLLIVGCYTDIQERKQYEEDLIQAREKAEMADNMKSTYLANMSHEIRTPLNAIVGFSELLSFAEDPEEKQSYIDIIKANNDQLLHLIGDILDLSKIEAGLLAVTYEQIELNELMDEIHQSIRLKIAPEIDFTVEKEFDSFLLVTDRSRLHQVITNLLNNAIKHTEQGRISFGYRRADEGHLYFYVSDTGTGIPAEKLEKIFSRHVMLNQKKQGFGLGLAISKGIVEKFGGTVYVTSEEGKGSTFSFIIPIRQLVE